MCSWDRQKSSCCPFIPGFLSAVSGCHHLYAVSSDYGRLALWGASGHSYTEQPLWCSLQKCMKHLVFSIFQRINHNNDIHFFQNLCRKPSTEYGNYFTQPGSSAELFSAFWEILLLICWWADDISAECICRKWKRFTQFVLCILMLWLQHGLQLCTL